MLNAYVLMASAFHHLLRLPALGQIIEDDG